jgi:hypothetical protein
MGKSSGPSTQVVEQRLSPQAQRLLDMYVPEVQNLYKKPYEQYQGNRVSGFNNDQNSAFGMLRQGSNSPRDIGMSRELLSNTLRGNYLNSGVPLNPMYGQRAGDNVMAGQRVGNNQFLGQKTNVMSNPFLQENNPWLEKTLAASMRDVKDQFRRNVTPQTDALFARQGAFGGSAWRDAQAQNEKALAGQLSNMSMNARMQDYNNRMQLQESDIGRRMQADQADIARNAQLAEAGLGRQQADIGRDAGLMENALNRQQSAIERDANLYQNKVNAEQAAFQAERARQMQAAGLMPGLSQAEFADTLNRSNALLTSGDRQRALDQALLDQQYQDWAAKQGWDENRLNMLRNAVGTAMGGGGSSVQQSDNSRSPGASLLGAGLTGAGAYGSLMGAGATAAAPWLAGGLGLLSLLS